MDGRSRVAWLLTYAQRLQEAYLSWPSLRKSKEHPPPTVPHESLVGVVDFCVAEMQKPEVKLALPVRLHDVEDWPPVRNHPTVRNIREVA